MKTFDIAEHERRIDSLVAGFSCAHMSNSKWKKVFATLDTPDTNITQIILKLVGDKPPRRTWCPTSEDLEEKWVAEGNGEYSYFYKEIEWITLPCKTIPYGFENVPAKHTDQDVDRAEELLSCKGKLLTERTDEGLKINGYGTYRDNDAHR